MRKIFAIAWKDTILRFTGLTEWLFFLILPIVSTLVLAGGTGGSGDSRIRLEVVDQAQTPLSQQIFTDLSKSDAIHPVTVTLSKAESDLSQRQVSAVLVIPPEFNLAALEHGQI